MSLKLMKYFGPRGCILTVIVQVKIGFEVYAAVVEYGVFDYKGALGVGADYLDDFGALRVPLNVPGEAFAFGAAGEVFVEVYDFSHT